MPSPSISIAIPGPYGVRVVGWGKNLMVDVDPVQPMTTTEAEGLATQICKAVEKVRGMNRPRYKFGDSR